MSKTPFMYRFLKALLTPVFKFYYNPKIYGKENIPTEGACLIAGNHKHLYDQCLAIISTKRYIKYMAKKEYFDNKWVAWFFKSVGCISVDRQHGDHSAVVSAIDTLKDGGAIGIFPEGTRNRTQEQLLPFKYGAVSMAKKTDAYIVPFAITGDYKFRSKNLKVVFGKPFKVTDMDVDDANKLLYNTIKDLLDKSI